MDPKPETKIEDAELREAQIEAARVLYAKTIIDAGRIREAAVADADRTRNEAVAAAGRIRNETVDAAYYAYTEAIDAAWKTYPKPRKPSIFRISI